ATRRESRAGVGAAGWRPLPSGGADSRRTRRTPAPPARRQEPSPASSSRNPALLLLEGSIEALVAIEPAIQIITVTQPRVGALRASDSAGAVLRDLPDRGRQSRGILGRHQDGTLVAHYV